MSIDRAVSATSQPKRAEVLSPVLWVKGAAGLGNRLFAASYAADLAKRSGAALVIDWLDGQIAPPGFDWFSTFFELQQQDVLSPLTILSVPMQDEDNLLRYLREPWYTNWLMEPVAVPKLNLAFRKVLRKPCLDVFWKHVYTNDVMPVGRNLRPRDIARQNNITIFAHHRPPACVGSIRRLRIREGSSPALADVRGRAEMSVGVHVRHGDKTPTRPISLLFERLKKRYGRGAHFFLTTDSADVQAEFTANFPNTEIGRQVTALPNGIESLHHLQRHDRNADQKLSEALFLDSVTDLYALIHCRELVFQRNSSFSYFAALNRNNVNDWDWLKGP